MGLYLMIFVFGATCCTGAFLLHKEVEIWLWFLMAVVGGLFIGFSLPPIVHLIWPAF
jgi:hypothetical protein